MVEPVDIMRKYYPNAEINLLHADYSETLDAVVEIYEIKDQELEDLCAKELEKLTSMVRELDSIYRDICIIRYDTDKESVIIEIIR